MTSAKSTKVKAVDGLRNPQGEPDEGTAVQPWHHGEPHKSWWLGLDRQNFSQAVKVEAPRIAGSSMARRIYGIAYDYKNR